jgi:hypothetical protein
MTAVVCADGALTKSEKRQQEPDDDDQANDVDDAVHGSAFGVD